jgi:hypothetical protein
MLADAVTGYAKKQGCVDPWMVVFSTEFDLSESLEMWKILVEAIHNRMGGTEVGSEPVYGLANDQLLNTMPNGFAKSFFAGALKPRFRYIAPRPSCPDTRGADRPALRTVLLARKHSNPAHPHLTWRRISDSHCSVRRPSSRQHPIRTLLRALRHIRRHCAMGQRGGAHLALQCRRPRQLGKNGRPAASPGTQ